MATRPIVPRGDGEGSLGTSAKMWGDVRTKKVNGMNIGDLGGVPVGFVAPFIRSTAPDGWLSCAGAEVSRTAYPDLWNFVNGSSQLISETDWQSKNTAGEKNIGWFSSGDGTTTFRLPRIVGSGELTEVKRFTTAGAGSFTAPITGIYRITLQGAGGGGGASGNPSSTLRGGGGGGQGGHGEFYEKLIAGTTYNFTIGAGGASGSNGGNSNILINGVDYQATGGQAGLAVTSTTFGAGGDGGAFYIDSALISNSAAGSAGGVSGSSVYGIGGTGGGGCASPQNSAPGASVLGGGGAGGTARNSSTMYSGGAGGDGYIEFSYNPVPQFWYVRAFGSASNQGTIDITELANALNAKLSIADVPKVAGFNAKQTFTSSGTFAAPITGLYKITLIGGQGGGGGAGTDSHGVHCAGNGGNHGGVFTFYEKLTTGTSYAFTIGAGGTAGSAGGSANNAPGTAGGNGGTSEITIGSNVYQATGGAGGTAAGGHEQIGDTGIGYLNGTGVPFTRGSAGGAGNAGVANNARGGEGGAGNGVGTGWNGQGGSIDFNTTYKAGVAGANGRITFEWLDTSLL